MNNEAEGEFSVILTESRIEMWEVVTTANSNSEDRRPVSEYSVIPDESKYCNNGVKGIDHWTIVYYHFQPTSFLISQYL